MVEISVVLPCRNEEQALPLCLEQIKKIALLHRLEVQIIVSDSSSDNSSDIAKDFGVDLIKHDKVGYGRAYQEGFKAVQGKYVFMADCDGSYDFSEIPRFVQYLREGFDMVMGNRFERRMQKGAMPTLHKVGNPLLSTLLRLKHKSHIKDAHCGMRAITKDALDKLACESEGMEFASEMIIKAKKQSLTIKQVPIRYYQRKGRSKMRSFRDGLRHLKLITST